ncbi:DUF5304 domain-containing protein [Streptomyces werraensis]|uniref:DUF5304 domain-containing protein n=1 Tax=Streptomyces werraensis TaxID=68284 RepID=UPI0037D87EEC
MSEQLPPPDDTGNEAGDETFGKRADDARDARAEAPSEVHDDAWATAAAEDLEAERARRRARHGPPPGSAAEEFKKLVDAVADKLSDLRPPLLGGVAGPAAQQVVRQVVQQAKAAVEPVIERNPDVFDHLAAAGSELLAAYRSAVQDQERRWTARDTPPRDPEERRDPGDDPGDDPGTGPGERIDLD